MDIEKIPLKLVFPSPMNPRKTFDEDALRELAENIEKQGLLQPITVRPRKHPCADEYDYPTKYEIVCGERRYRAFCLLSEKWSAMDAVAPKGETFNRFSDITAIVREMTDAEAFDAMITENLQRKDVDPMEEAYAFTQLHERGDSVEDIALRFGKSVRFVQDRIKLNALIPELMLAVKEGKFSISGAMIIAKLDEDAQRRYFKTNGNYLSKQTATNFVNQMFMRLANSVWTENGDADFSGGCALKCSECYLNTANHGCLFYEMKGEEGKCTDRAKYVEKTVAYMLEYIDQSAGMLVKKGDPLSFGRCVVGLTLESYENEESKDMKKRILSALEQRGIEVVDPHKYFQSKCWYEADDQRLADKLNSGEAYRVLTLFNYQTPKINTETWYFRKGGSDATPGGQPIEVTSLLNKLRDLNNVAPISEAMRGREAIAEHAKPHGGALYPVEKQAFMALLIHESPALKRLLKIDYSTMRDQVYELLEGENAPNVEFCIRAYLAEQFGNKDTAVAHHLMPVTEAIGNLQCKEQYAQAVEKAKAKTAKDRKKIIDKLAALGYDENGEKLG